MQRSVLLLFVLFILFAGEFRRNGWNEIWKITNVAKSGGVMWMGTVGFVLLSVGSLTFVKMNQIKTN